MLRRSCFYNNTIEKLGDFYTDLKNQGIKEYNRSRTGGDKE